jgi:hypothetical protein
MELVVDKRERGVREHLDRPEDPLAASIFLGCFSFDETVLLHFF